MRRVLLSLLVTGCFRESTPPPSSGPPSAPSERAAKRDPDRSRTMPEVPPATCATDADCRLSYAGPACCPPENECGRIVSTGQIAAYKTYCRGVDCGPPMASSSCMGVMGLRGVCKQGTCEGTR